MVSYGPIINKLVKEIKNKKLNITVFEAIYVRPILDKYVDELTKYERVIIYDAYSTEVGFANTLVAELVSKGYKGEIIVKAIPDVYVDHATINEQLDKFALQPEEILKLL